MVVTRRREEFMTKLQNSNSKIHILRNVASKKVRKVEKGEEIYPSIHKDNLRYAQSNATKFIQESEQGRRAAFKEDHSQTILFPRREPPGSEYGAQGNQIL